MRPLEDLATALKEHITKFCSQYELNNHRNKSFDFSVAAPQSGNTDNEQQREQARLAALRCINELQQVLMSPSEIVRDIGAKVTDAMCLHTIHRFNILDKIPQEGDRSIDSLALECNLNPIDLTRILRYSATAGILAEEPTGTMRHTVISQAIVTDSLLRDNVGIFVEEMFPAAAMMTEALSRAGNTQSPTMTGWTLANNADTPFFTHLAAHNPARLATLQRGMSTTVSSLNAAAFAQSYDWSSLPTLSPVFVDVCGGSGVVAVAVATQVPSARCIVQDIPGAEAAFEAFVPQVMRDTERITFMSHDVFALQPFAGADVYFLRAVMRNWPDHECVRILSALVPALKKGARVIINDPIMPPPEASQMRSAASNGLESTAGPPKIPLEAERLIRGFDLNMMTFFHGRDREASEWGSLFAKADPRYDFLGVQRPTKGVKGLPPGAVLGYGEAIWMG